MPLLTDLFGQQHYVGTLTEECDKILEKYPRAVDNPRLFNYYFLIGRLPQLAQWEEKDILALREACNALESVSRARRKLNEKQNG